VAVKIAAGMVHYLFSVVVVVYFASKESLFVSAKTLPSLSAAKIRRKRTQEMKNK